MFNEVSLDRMYEDMFAVLEARIEFTKHAIENHDLDYLYVLLKEIDAIQHVFWAHMEEDHPEYGDAILDGYRLVDELIGWIMNQCDTNLLVFSDHGFQQRTTEVSSEVDSVAQAIANVIPIPKSVKRFYRSVTQSPIETKSDGTAVSSTTGVHDNPAVWMLDGPQVESNDNRNINFEDISPTILSLLDEPIPDDYVGAPIEDIKKVPEYQSRSLSIHRGLSIEDSEVVSKRLHNLGYADMVDEE
jgi:predicted AlkP superfamily phosphohydrolase/phosphomutase